MVRRRKTSDESTNPTPARQTRQRRNAEDESLGEVGTPDISQVLPSTGRRRRNGQKKESSSPSKDLSVSTRSRGLITRKSSSDSDIENKLEPPNMDTSYLTRLRAKRAATDSLQSPVENAEVVTMMETKRYTKLKRVLAATSNNTSLENTSAFKTPAKVTRSQAKIVSAKVNPMSDDDEMPSATKVEYTEKIDSVDAKPARDLKNIRSLALKRIIGTPTTVSPRPRMKSASKVSADTVTPESSPMLINLTPHRSTKTPKKSPKNIGSPKTHSQSPLRLSKTPRKLTVNDESPTISDNSSISAKQGPPREMSETDCDPFVLLKDFKKEGIDDSNGIRKLPLQDISCTPQPPIAGRRKAKKSPKTSPPKSSKKVFKKSPVQSLRRSSTTQDSTEQGPQKSPRNSAGKRHATLGSKIRKSPLKTLLPLGKKSASPRLETRVSTPTKTILNAVGTGKLDTPMSPKRSRTSMEKRSPITSSGTPLRPIPTPKTDTVVESGVVPIPMCTVSVNNMKMLLEMDPISPSALTPRNRVRRSLNLTPDFRTLSSNSTSSPLPMPKTGSAKKGQSLLLTLGKLGTEPRLINDESLELIDGNEFMNSSTDVMENSGPVKDGTYDLVENTETEVNKKVEKNGGDKVDDDTYELLEPKTPILQRTTRKRSLANVEPDNCTPEAKKRCRVRFLSPTPEAREKGSSMVLGRRIPTVNTPAKQQQTTTRSLRGSIGKTTPRRSRSLTKIDEKIPVQRSGVKKRSISASEVSKKRPNLSQKHQISVNRLSQARRSVHSEVKTETKMPSARKAPNFAQIHQRKFAQMESLVDAKKRVAKRHIDLSTLPSTIPSHPVVPELLASSSSTTPTPAQTTNGTFNRFGFKLRKAEALKVITKNPPAVTRKRNHETNRNLLQGVRTNRRFELLMKARNIQ